MIRKFSKINTPEQIAETLQVTKEFVIGVLQNESYVHEPQVTYQVPEKDNTTTE